MAAAPVKATPVKRIEKDFLLKVLFDEQLPLIYLRHRAEYAFVLETPAGTELSLRTLRSMPALKTRRNINLMFDYRGQMISFTVEITSIRDRYIKTSVPDFLYKNLVRSFSRVNTPTDLQVQFSFLENRYSLGYPRVTEYENEDLNNLMKELNTDNLGSLITQMTAWIKGCAGGHKVILFKDEIKPVSTEERLLAETGKALYLPDIRYGFPTEDPFPRKRIITEDLFKRYLESTGVGQNYIDEAADRFIKAKEEEGLSSDAWAPILFQEYVIGYVHIWVKENDGKPPFDFTVIDTLYQFSKILAFSLKENGYFDKGLLNNKPFDGQVIDISASGLLFAYPHSDLSGVLVHDSELSVRLVTPNRAITTDARIVRQYKDPTTSYFGCRFGNMEPGDMRFLFEYIYGKPFTEADAQFLAGQV